ncbi:MAG: hypothetical protein ABSB42_22185 [Tepidisphaeraceae bacterium]|jgi:hypothetical protein
MKSYLQHLENNEAILLMYLGNELPAQDRVEFEQMLASDGALRREMEIVRQTQQLAFDALSSLDAVTRPPLLPIVAQRRVSQLVREWADRRRRPVGMVSEAGRQMPWRRISIAAAASLLVGSYIWAVYHHLLDPRSISDNNPPVSVTPDPYFDGDALPNAPQHRDLSNEEKVALLSIPLEDSTSDESNLHVAEVAAVIPSDAENSGDANTESSLSGAAGLPSAHSSDLNTTGEP